MKTLEGLKLNRWTKGNYDRLYCVFYGTTRGYIEVKNGKLVGVFSSPSYTDQIQMIIDKGLANVLLKTTTTTKQWMEKMEKAER